ncbi:ABC transporter permease subunit [Arthrobacter sp. B0490]|uniref:ABC transporter permease subunit n=1 Tax=Arthrobacter sp. B0490 TaxID=2058891 RepID=UPI000CE427F9|nr:ABC transporter permease subunit [Arthrobacter sp. B0490]
MATSTSPAPAQQRPRQNRDSGSGVNFGRVLKSEWIKVTTVPSTVILIVSTVVVMVGLAALASWAISITQDEIQSAGAPQGGPGGPGMEGFNAAEQAWMIPSSGLIFGQLLIASLAVVLIASEWATGMIRSTMVAVPKRMPALLAKNVIIAAIAFVIGAGSAFLSYLVAQPILGGDLDFGLTTDGVLPSIVNTGTYLALIAIISMAIGTLLRNTAGGVVTAVALFFVVPLIIVNLLSGLADWIPDAARFLPTNAGDQLVAITTQSDALTQWEGGLVMGAWALVLLVVSLVVTQKRDV